MDKERDEFDIQPVKGSDLDFYCYKCGKEFTTTFAGSFFCHDCQFVINDKIYRELKVVKRWEAGAEEREKDRKANELIMERMKADKADKEKKAKAQEDKAVIDALLSMPYEKRLNQMKSLKIKIKYGKANEPVFDPENSVKELEGN